MIKLWMDFSSAGLIASGASILMYKIMWLHSPLIAIFAMALSFLFDDMYSLPNEAAGGYIYRIAFLGTVALITSSFQVTDLIQFFLSLYCVLCGMKYVVYKLKLNNENTESFFSTVSFVMLCASILI